LVSDRKAGWKTGSLTAGGRKKGKEGRARGKGCYPWDHKRPRPEVVITCSMGQLGGEFSAFKGKYMFGGKRKRKGKLSSSQ